MRLPRLTTRRLMVLVAVVAILSAIGVDLQRRKARFDQLSRYHAKSTKPREISPGVVQRFYHTAKGRWHFLLSEKYADAARHPWLPVPPDPPPPE